MKRTIAAVLIGLSLSVGQPASAQTTADRQGVAEIQTLLSDVGRWSQDYQTAVNQAVEPLSNIQSFLDILDRFNAGDLRAEQARTQIQNWRAQSLGAIDRARIGAEALRSPPSMALLGPGGEDIERALNAARDNMLPLLLEFERVVNACADLGLEAVRDSAKGVEVRQRALLNAQMQLVRVDLGRINLSVAAVSPQHPTHHVMIATEHYYAALLAVPAYALDVLDDRGDQTAVVAAMRASAQNMRASLATASARTEEMRAQLRSQLGGPSVEIARTGLQVLDTYPATIRAFTAIANNIDRAAAAIERGEDVLVVWGDQEEWDMPHLNEIDRLDRVRAGLLANNAGAL